MKGSREDWEKEAARDTPGYSDVDTSAIPQEMIDGMRETAKLEAVIEIRRKIAPFLDPPQGGNVLDVGCGLADVLIDLASRRKDLTCTGLDRSAKMLEVAAADAAAAGVDIRFETASALELPFPDDSFDLVRTERMLQWVDPPEKAFQEIIRVTKPGGMVVAMDTDWRTAAIDLGDERSERLIAEAFAAEWKMSAGGRLRRWALEAGMDVTGHFSVCSTFTDWDPDAEPAPPGLPPPFALAKIVQDLTDATEQDGAVLEESMLRAGREKRFHFSVSMYALAATKSSS